MKTLQKKYILTVDNSGNQRHKEIDPSITFQIPCKLRDDFKKRCNYNMVSIKEQMLELITDWLEKEGSC